MGKPLEAALSDYIQCEIVDGGFRWELLDAKIVCLMAIDQA